MNTMNQKDFINFFYGTNDLIFILDFNGKILEINNIVSETLGYTRNELIDKNILEIYPSEIANKTQIDFKEIIDNKTNISNISLLTKNNLKIPVEIKMYHGTWNSESAIIGIYKDLSKIALSEEKFYKVFNINNTIMAISEIETGIFINVNEQFLKTTGYNKNEIIGRSSKDLEIFYDYNQRIEIAKYISNNKNVENKNVIFRKKNGELIYVLISVAIIKIQTYDYLLTTAIDITQLRNTEKQLKFKIKQQTLISNISQILNTTQNIENKIEEILRLLGEHTNVSRIYIFEDDAKGETTSNTYEWCNKGIISQKEELQNIPYENIPSWNLILEKQGKIFSTNIEELPEDIIAILDHQNIISILIFPIFVQGKKIGFIGFDECTIERQWEIDEIELLRTTSNIFSNTYERIRYQKRLIESEIQLKLAIENTETGLWDWNVVTGDVYFNDIWCSMLGYKKSEIEPNVSSWEKLVHPDDMPAIQEELNKHLKGETEYYQTIHRLRTKSGDWKWIIDKGKVIELDDEGNPLRAIGTHTDIDNQKRIETELINANSTKDKIFSIIAHDLRSPIADMILISDLVSEEILLDQSIIDNNPTLKNLFTSFKKMSKNTYQLLENLLNWALYNKKEILYKPQKFVINEIIEQNIDVIKFQAENKNITIFTNYKKQFSVYADKDMINLVIRNLLYNALKFTSTEGFIKIDINNDENHVKVIVSDTGIGISQENIVKIISENEFYTKTGTNNEKGTGLGLKLCKSFIEINKGELHIKSKINQGSSFSFTLPKEMKNILNKCLL